MKRAGRILIAVFVTLLILLALIFLYFSSTQETQTLSHAVREEAPGKMITLQSGETHYALAGADTAELIIFIHGGGITGQEVWKNTLPFFQKHGYQTLAYDLYDRGYSDRVDHDNNPALFQTQLTQLIDSLYITKTFTLVSMSFGAMIALEFFHDHPEKVSKLILLDPALTGDFKPNPLLKLPIVSDFLMTTYWYPRAVENQRKEFVNQEIFDVYAERLAYFMNFKGYKRSNHSTWMNMLDQNKLPLLKTLPENRVLLIFGARDPYFPASNIPLYKSTYPSIEIHTVAQAGHMPHLEQPDIVNPIMLTFLNQ